MPAKLTPQKQLHDWLDGKPACPNTSGECCPDFSCCRAELLQPLEVRQRFISGTQKQRDAMLMSFLSAFVAKIDPKVRVIGSST